MSTESVEEALSIFDAALPSNSLSNLQELVIRHCWEGRTYTQIAEICGYDDDYIRDVGFQLWKQLSKSLGQKVSKSNFKSVLRHHSKTDFPVSNPSPPSTCLTDWGTAADVPLFFGRERELATLTQWVKQDRCRLVSILGMGGMGKTSFSIRLAQTLQNDFEALVWRSLKAAPPLDTLLTNLLKTLAPAPDVLISDNTAGKIEQFIEALRARRCLIILDNLEVLLESGQNCGTFQSSYEDYKDLIQSVGEISHQSCVFITSREKLQGVDELEGEHFPVRTLYLSGLDPASSQKILDKRDLAGTPQDFQALIDYYSGHPLALKIISTSIRDLFAGNIGQFLAQGAGVFNGLQRLLFKQIHRLSNLEEAILYWLAIHTEPVSIEQLVDDLVPQPSKPALLEALESLIRRSLLETIALGNSAAYTLQPVIMECLIDRLVETVCIEIKTITPQYLLSHALIKAQTEDNLRDTQTRLILQPLSAQLTGQFGAVGLCQQLRVLLKHLQTLTNSQIGYGGGNLVNLLRHLESDLTGYNFSGLTLRQAILHDLSLQRTDFSRVTFQQCTFANTFGGITSIAFSPDGASFATCDTNGNVAIWSVEDQYPTAKCVGHNFWTWAVTFSPNSQKLASCGQDQTIRIWDAKTGHCCKILQGHISIVLDIAFSPCGSFLLSSSNDGSIKLWDIDKGICQQTFVGHKKCVWGVVFDPDGQSFYSGGEDNCIRYWDLKTGECLKVFAGHTQWVMTIALSPDGLLLASAGMDNTVKLWCTSTGNCLFTLSGHQAPVVSVAFSPDSRTLASGSYDQTVRLWNTRTGNCTQRLDKHTNRIWCVRFHPSKPLLASGGDDNTTRFWNPQTGEATTTLQGYSNGIYAIALHPCQSLLASAHEDQTIRLWQTLTHVSNSDHEALEPYQTLRGHQNRILAIAFSPNGQTLASGSLDRTIKLWNPETTQCRVTLQGHTSWIWDIAFHPNSKILASASYDRTIKVWDIESGHCTHTLGGHLGSALSVAFSPDGQWLASGGYQQMLKLWRLNGDCVRTWYAHPNRIWTVAFSPDSQWLATGGEDHQIMIWEVATGDLLQTLSGHQQSVLCLRFSADGKTLFSSSGDHTLKQWDISTGQCLQTYSGHEHWAWSVALASDKLLLSGSQDETIRCWDIKTGQPLQRLSVPRPYAGMNITDAEGLSDAQFQALAVLGAFHAPAP